LLLPGILIGLRDALSWVTTATWFDTSLQSLFGPLSYGDRTGGGFKARLWQQPLWVLILVGGAFPALLGAVLLDDETGN
jgi:hypothetical protein